MVQEQVERKTGWRVDPGRGRVLGGCSRVQDGEGSGIRSGLPLRSEKEERSTEENGVVGPWRGSEEVVVSVRGLGSGVQPSPAKGSLLRSKSPGVLGERKRESSRTS